jgi:hypothetical protein
VTCRDQRDVIGSARSRLDKLGFDVSWLDQRDMTNATSHDVRGHDGAGLVPFGRDQRDATCRDLTRSDAIWSAELRQVMTNATRLDMTSRDTTRLGGSRSDRLRPVQRDLTCPAGPRPDPT